MEYFPPFSLTVAFPNMLLTSMLSDTLSVLFPQGEKHYMEYHVIQRFDF
jgi:predicted metal-dependent hydrolase